MTLLGAKITFLLLASNIQCTLCNQYTSIFFKLHRFIVVGTEFWSNDILVFFLNVSMPSIILCWGSGVRIISHNGNTVGN